MFSKFMKKILSISNMSLKVPPIKIGVQATLLNMPQELYEDAIFFVNQGIETIDPFIQLRYKRVALMCFCASTEAWINTQLRSYIIQSRFRIAGSYEQKVLDFIEQPAAALPQDYLGIKKRLYSCVGKIFTGHAIDPRRDVIDAFEKYIELTEARNSLVHYATKDREIVYDQYFGNPPLGITKSVNDAPKIIFDLYHAIHSLNNAFTVPLWIASE